MKKIIFALAIAGMFGFVSCNTNKAEENDTLTNDSMVENCEMGEDDTLAADTIVYDAVEEIAE